VFGTTRLLYGVRCDFSTALAVFGPRRPVGKVGSVFCSARASGGRNHARRFATLLHHRMIIVGLHTFADLATIRGVRRHAYGAST
jgi:hypothetical protein